jgi:hypothetical protein
MSPCDFNRRQFLKYTGAAGAATMALTLSMDDVAQAAAVAPLPVGTPILVIVTLYGGVPVEPAGHVSRRLRGASPQ